MWTGERSRGNSEFSKTFSTQEGLPFKEEDITHTESQPAKVPGELRAFTQAGPPLQRWAMSLSFLN